MRRIVVLVLLAVLLAVFGLWEGLRPHASDLRPEPDPKTQAVATAAGPDPGPRPEARGPRPVVISGAVVDRTTQTPVAGVTVTFRNASSETTATSGADGSYTVTVAPGEYRAYATGSGVVTIGAMDLDRLPSAPRPELAGVADDNVLPLIRARSDLRGIEISVARTGAITGHVLDTDAHPIAHAVVRARAPKSALHPASGSDIAETDDDGAFALAVAPGTYELDASHPQFAGALPDAGIEVQAGGSIERNLVLASGCVVTGRVVRSDGKPAVEGAIEVGTDEASFQPRARIEPDGTFRWSAVDQADVLLRAWPWKSPPSPARSVRCGVGSRLDDVVLEIPDVEPSISGVLVDARGAPVPLAHIEIAPFDPSGMHQQERSDLAGEWAVYGMPPGKYAVTIAVPGRGVISATVDAPSHRNRLGLGGTGRISGTTTAIVDGAFETSFDTCDAAIQLPHETRLVPVVGGRFTIDDVPACHLAFTARWRDNAVQAQANVTLNDTAHVELDLGAPRAKTVHGTVRDREAHPIAGASVTAKQGDRATTARSDADGHYSLQSFAGALVQASSGARVGTATVGRANVADEYVDIVVQ